MYIFEILESAVFGLVGGGEKTGLLAILCWSVGECDALLGVCVLLLLLNVIRFGRVK